METVYSVITGTTNKTALAGNWILRNDFIRIFLLIALNVAIGYTFQPVPKWVNNLFDTSTLFKFVIMFVLGCVSVYPLNATNLLWVLVCTVVVLLFMAGLRKLDKKEAEIKTEVSAEPKKEPVVEQKKN